MIADNYKSQRHSFMEMTAFLGKGRFPYKFGFNRLSTRLKPHAMSKGDRERFFVRLHRDERSVK